MNASWRIPRRSFLKGLGTAVALPMLDVMASRALGGTTAANTPPLRLAFLFVPNGAHMPDWTPKREGADFDLPFILRPLQPFQRDLLVMTGLTHDKGRDNGDGPGDHARSASVFLTGAQPLKSEGAEIRSGVSVDQLAAKHIGNRTRFASLQLGVEPGRQAGKCDSGYSCAYSNNISWADEATPMPNEVNPRQVFERLFGNGVPGEVSASQAKRQRYNKSILDFVLEDARRLDKQVSGRDRLKLDEYLTAIREIERRIEFTEKENNRPDAIAAARPAPAGVPDNFQDHARLLGDMLVLAFQADLTRICSFMLANEGSNASYRQIGVNEGHHSLSHHQNDPKKQAQIARINNFHVHQFAYVLQRLKSIPEGDGSLLDHCMILYGGGISDGNRHNNENLPLVLAGRAGGSIATGRHVRYPEETPVCNLFLSMLDRLGVPAERFGDSTGRLPWLQA